ncbi:MAG: Bug family tripartite tricarboxylate transporter substrate binding protein [Rhodospirillaceae bacterium]
MTLYRSFLAVATFAMLGALAHAEYPERPIRVIVPFAPGGNVDLAARSVTPGLGELLGRSVVVDNRAGAGGAVGAEIVAGANPDGYTLLVGSTGLLTIAPVVFPKLQYDPVRDFAAVALISDVPLVMMVNANSPAKTVAEFISLARSGARELTMASSGNFSTGQLAGALFQSVTKTRFVHVPYKGASPAVTDLIAGHVDVIFDQMSSAIGYVRGNRLRALAITAKTRAPELPDVPTMQEAGVPGVEAGTFTAMLAPAKTPAPIIGKLNQAMRQVLSSNGARAAFAKQGAHILQSTPQSAGKYIVDELEKWRRVVRTAGIKPENQ